MKIVIISGTNRPGSNTRKITGLLKGFYGAAGATPEILDLANLPAEIFLPTSYAEKPASFGAFSDQVLAADGLHVVTPEYNGSLPGVLKYFIDMLPFPESFEGRPVAFTGLAAGQWGALRPVEQLQAIFGYRNAHIFPTRVFLPQVGGLLSEDGQITDGDIAKRLNAQAAGFATFVGKLKAA
ncbi:MAG: NAD(P)H-dependent oxidoreductase [Terrimicrobiaceae bacterium]